MDALPFRWRPRRQWCGEVDGSAVVNETHRVLCDDCARLLKQFLATDKSGKPAGYDARQQAIGGRAPETQRAVVGDLDTRDLVERVVEHGGSRIGAAFL